MVVSGTVVTPLLGPRERKMPEFVNKAFDTCLLSL